MRCSGPGGGRLADVLIVVDGEEVGRTDEDGECLLTRAAEPSSIELRHGDWSARVELPLDDRLIQAVELGPPH